MSEKFGLDWKEYDFERIYPLLIAMAEVEKKRAGNNKPVDKQAKFRPRSR